MPSREDDPVPFPLPPVITTPMIAAALKEDLGDAGDLTSLATVSDDVPARALISTRADGVLSGLEMAVRVFTSIEPTLRVTTSNSETPPTGDGHAIRAGDTFLTIEGPARHLLTAERVALNYLTHMSGIATATARFVEAVAGTPANIACTRKTLPGLRALQKHAVRCGGGGTHRFGLHDAVMIKDNHIIAAGGIEKAIRRARAYSGHTVRIEIEVDTLEQLEKALPEAPDIILLDNMSIDSMKRAVTLTAGSAVLEASGNVTLSTVRQIAETGVDVISSGWLTHSPPALDIGMELEVSD